MLVQLREVIDEMEFLLPGKQLLFELDHSGTHLSKGPEGLNANVVNMKFGGKAAILRDSLMTVGCVGPVDEPANMYQHPTHRDTWSSVYRPNWVQHDCRVKIGDVQKFTFPAGSPPPFNHPTAAAADYIGKPKGAAQLLWERGLFREGMTLKGNLAAAPVPAADDGGAEQEDQLADVPAPVSADTDPVAHAARLDAALATNSARFVLANCADYLNEPSMVEGLIRERGHLVLISPKCHPELAGSGIEYCWGFAKRFFRKQNAVSGATACTSANLIERALASLQEVKLAHVLAFSRRTRRYRFAYMEGARVGDGTMEYVDIEKMVKLHKCHRCIDDQECQFLEAHLALRLADMDD
jgi:hypothetical protein